MSRKRRSTPSLSELRTSMVQVKIGNRIYDGQYVANCLTCKHPARMKIEERILLNHSIGKIAAAFSEVIIEGEGGHPVTLPKVTEVSIRNHYDKGHMPLDAARMRALSERRARVIGAKYGEHIEDLVDHVTLAEAVLTRTHERLMRSEIEPEVSDGLTAAKFLRDMEERQEQNNLDAEAWSEAMTVYFETARQFMDETTWAEFTTALTINPILRALERRLHPDTVIDGEVVEPTRHELERGA